MIRDPATAAYAWSRYRRIMRWLLAAAIALVVAALRLAGRTGQGDAVRRCVGAALGLGLVMLAGSAVMGLAFLLPRRRAPGENPPPAPRRSDVPE